MEPRFRAGASVLQWWSSWFKNEGPAPQVYSKKNRPSWFAGEILGPAVWAEDKVYAGVKYTGWVYSTHCWDGTAEIVPEPYLMPVSVMHCFHSCGKCDNPPPAPAFWMEANAN